MNSYEIWSSIILASCYSCPCVLPPTLHHVCSMWPTEYHGSGGVWCRRLGHKRHCCFCLAPLDHSPATMPWVCPSSPVERCVCWGTKASQQITNHVSEPFGKWILGSSEAIGWTDCIPRQHLHYRHLKTVSRTIQLSCSWIPDSQK